MSSVVRRFFKKPQHIGKQAGKYRFCFKIRSLENLPDQYESVSVGFSRGSKLPIETPLVKIHQGYAVFAEDEGRLEWVSTIYTDSHRKFSDKPFKLYLKAVPKKQPHVRAAYDAPRPVEVGKLSVNISDFAGHSSSSHPTCKVSLAGKRMATMEMTVHSNFLSNSTLRDGDKFDDSVSANMTAATFNDVEHRYHDDTDEENTEWEDTATDTRPNPSEPSQQSTSQAPETNTVAEDRACTSDTAPPSAAKPPLHPRSTLQPIIPALDLDDVVDPPKVTKASSWKSQQSNDDSLAISVSSADGRQSPLLDISGTATDRTGAAMLDDMSEMTEPSPRVEQQSDYISMSERAKQLLQKNTELTRELRDIHRNTWAAGRDKGKSRPSIKEIFPDVAHSPSAGEQDQIVALLQAELEAKDARLREFDQLLGDMDAMHHDHSACLAQMEALQSDILRSQQEVSELKSSRESLSHQLSDARTLSEQTSNDLAELNDRYHHDMATHAALVADVEALRAELGSRTDAAVSTPANEKDLLELERQLEEERLSHAVTADELEQALAEIQRLKASGAPDIDALKKSHEQEVGQIREQAQEELRVALATAAEQLTQGQEEARVALEQEQCKNVLAREHEQCHWEKQLREEQEHTSRAVSEGEAALEAERHQFEKMQKQLQHVTLQLQTLQQQTQQSSRDMDFERAWIDEKKAHEQTKLRVEDLSIRVLSLEQEKMALEERATGSGITANDTRLRALAVVIEPELSRGDEAVPLEHVFSLVRTLYDSPVYQSALLELELAVAAEADDCCNATSARKHQALQEVVSFCRSVDGSLDDGLGFHTPRSYMTASMGGSLRDATSPRSALSVTCTGNVRAQLESRCVELEMENKQLQESLAHSTPATTDPNSLKAQYEQSLKSWQERACDYEESIGRLQKKADLMESEVTRLEGSLEKELAEGARRLAELQLKQKQLADSESKYAALQRQMNDLREADQTVASDQPSVEKNDLLGADQTVNSGQPSVEELLETIQQLRDENALLADGLGKAPEAIMAANEEITTLREELRIEQQARAAAERALGSKGVVLHANGVSPEKSMEFSNDEDGHVEELLLSPVRGGHGEEMQHTRHFVAAATSPVSAVPDQDTRLQVLTIQNANRQLRDDLEAQREMVASLQQQLEEMDRLQALAVSEGRTLLPASVRGLTLEEAEAELEHARAHVRDIQGDLEALEASKADCVSRLPLDTSDTDDSDVEDGDRPQRSNGLSGHHSDDHGHEDVQAQISDLDCKLSGVRDELEHAYQYMEALMLAVKTLSHDSRHVSHSEHSHTNGAAQHSTTNGDHYVPHPDDLAMLNHELARLQGENESLRARLEDTTTSQPPSTDASLVTANEQLAQLQARVEELTAQVQQKDQVVQRQAQDLAKSHQKLLTLDATWTKVVNRIQGRTSGGASSGQSSPEFLSPRTHTTHTTETATSPAPTYSPRWA